MFALLLAIQALSGSSGVEGQAAAGQQAGASAQPAAAVPCKVLAPTIAGSTSPTLFVNCGKYTRILGVADSYTTASNAAIGSLIVILHKGAQQHVVLISPTAGDAYHVDDITGDLAKASGRNPDAGLPADLAIDISGFAAGGNVKLPAQPKRQGVGLAIRDAAKLKGADSAAPAETATLNLAGLAAVAKSTAVTSGKIPAMPRSAGLQATKTTQAQN